MIRTLLLAALVAMALCQKPVDQSEYYGPRMGSGPFCDSKCLPEGRWTFRRDWIDLQSKIEDKYIFFGDGDADFWSSTQNCGEYINEFFINQMDSEDETFLLGCKPEILYFMELQMKYDHEDGLLESNLKLQGSYMITDVAWIDFITEYFDSPADTRRTSPWTLIRSAPSLVGATAYSTYDKDISFKQTFVANYERNFCTFVGSVVPIRERTYCDFTDEETDTTSFITPDFCQWLIGDFGDHDFNLNCGDTENCDGFSVTFDADPLDDDDDRRTVKKKPLSSPMEKAKQMLLSARLGAPVVKATPEQKARFMKERSQYDPASQAIPGFGAPSVETDNEAYWQVPWEDQIFYYVPYTSSITAPYCAYKD